MGRSESEAHAMWRAIYELTQELEGDDGEPRKLVKLRVEVEALRVLVPEDFGESALRVISQALELIGSAAESKGGDALQWIREAVKSRLDFAEAQDLRGPSA